jgi:hypothetical protein
MVEVESKAMEVVCKVETTLQGVKGVVGVLSLSCEDLKKILELEQNAERTMQEAVTRISNEGVREVSKRQTVLAIVKTPEFPQTLAPTVVLVSGGEIVGEEIADSRAEELKGYPGIIFVGEKFVIYRDRVKRLPAKDALFVFPPVSFPELENLDEIQDVISASPAPLTDVYIKSKGGWDVDDERLGTILIGFNLV